MRIKSLSLENIKSFEKVDHLEFSDINIFIGKNNSGKTTLLDAILCPHGRINQNHLRRNSETGGVRIELGSVDFSISGISDLGYVELILNISRRILQLLGRNSDNQNYNSVNWLPNNINQTRYIPFLSNRRNNNYIEQIRADQIENINYDYSNLPNLVDHLSNDQIEERLFFDEFCVTVLNFPVRSFSTANGKMPVKTISSSMKVLLTEMGDGVAHIMAIGAWLALAKNCVFVFDQIEADLHPSAIKAICQFIKRSSLQNKNQFFFATHSHVVLTSLASFEGTKLYRVDAHDERQSLTTSTVSEIQNEPSERILILRDLGYSIADFDISDSWLILEESSAQSIINFIIGYEFKSLINLKLISAGGISKVDKTFEDFRSIFVFANLEPVYSGRAWVVVDGDNVGKDVTARLQECYKKNWNESHFRCWTEENFEKYYPTEFNREIARVLDIPDKKLRQSEKVKLGHSVREWLKEDPTRGINALRESASEIFEFLEGIQKTLYPEAAS
ncbi:MAG: AAA family ATPase [Hyphomicrobiales bacterium]|nr:AAA family ATPase [Hyphomicrobiales bacterium]